MNLKERLKFEKEIFFIKYIFTKPFQLLWGSVTTETPSLLLFMEFIVLIIFLFRKIILYTFKNFPIIFDYKIVLVLIIMAITSVYSVYSNQRFQEDYKKDKEEKLKELFEE